MIVVGEYMHIEKSVYDLSAQLEDLKNKNWRKQKIILMLDLEDNHKKSKNSFPTQLHN